MKIFWKKTIEDGYKNEAKLRVHGVRDTIPAELDLSAGAPSEERARPGTMQIPNEIRDLLGPLIEMATYTWRLKVRMVDPQSGEPKDESRKLYRFVEGLFRALSDAGIQVIDKTGRPYDSGMSEKVINFEQVPGLLKEEIIETVRPSVRWKDQILFHGEIVVGIPVIESPPGEIPNLENVPVPSETPFDSTQLVEVTQSPVSPCQDSTARPTTPATPESTDRPEKE